VVRTIFEPGYQVEKHYHTGPVFAVTHSGSWYYKEYPEQVNTKGSYMFEPAHSVHTLTITEGGNEPTDVWFAIYGANIHVDEKGDVTFSTPNPCSRCIALYVPPRVKTATSCSSFSSCKSNKRRMYGRSHVEKRVAYLRYLANQIVLG